MDEGGGKLGKIWGAKGLCVTVHTVEGSWGSHPPSPLPLPENFGILDPLRSLLVHFQTIFGFQMTYEMTIYMEQKEKNNSCSGYKLYIFLVFSLRLPYAVYSLC